MNKVKVTRFRRLFCRCECGCRFKVSALSATPALNEQTYCLLERRVREFCKTAKVVRGTGVKRRPRTLRIVYTATQLSDLVVNSVYQDVNRVLERTHEIIRRG